MTLQRAVLRFFRFVSFMETVNQTKYWLVRRKNSRIPGVRIRAGGGKHMELVKGIKERRSTRKFTDQAVSEDDIREIVATAAYAPSWKNTQTSRYIAVVNPEKKQEIADTCVMGFAGNQRIIGEAPVLIVETTVNERSGYERDGSFSTSKGTHWQSYDAGLAGEAFCLAAWEKGLGTVIMGIFEEEKVKEVLQIPETESVSALIALGYPEEVPEAPKRKETEVLFKIVK